MQPYHLVWLSAHPHRSAQWLCERVAEGFDVHHIDFDRTNNDPANLVLIETTDHRRIHAGGNPLRTGRSINTARVEGEGKAAYEARRDSGGWAGQANAAIHWAKLYASAHDLPWPPSLILRPTKPRRYG